MHTLGIMRGRCGRRQGRWAGCRSSGRAGFRRPGHEESIRGCMRGAEAGAWADTGSGPLVLTDTDRRARTDEHGARGRGPPGRAAADRPRTPTRARSRSGRPHQGSGRCPPPLRPKRRALPGPARQLPGLSRSRRKGDDGAAGAPLTPAGRAPGPWCGRAARPVHRVAISPPDVRSSGDLTTIDGPARPGRGGLGHGRISLPPSASSMACRSSSGSSSVSPTS